MKALRLCKKIFFASICFFAILLQVCSCSIVEINQENTTIFKELDSTTRNEEPTTTEGKDMPVVFSNEKDSTDNTMDNSNTGSLEPSIPNNSNQTKWTLYILGKKVDNSGVREDEEGWPYIPILRILTELDFVITWESETVAKIEKEGVLYVFDLCKKSLRPINREETYNSICPPDGASNWKCITVDKDILVDDITCGIILWEMGEPCRFDFSLENKEIYLLN